MPQRIVPVLIAVLIVAFVAGMAFLNLPERLGVAPSPGSTGANLQLQAMVQKHMTPLLENPAFQQRVQGLGAMEAQRVGMEMSARGLARLDGSSLVTRAELMAVALDGAETRVCAGLARGNAQPADIEGALLRLGEARLETWAKVSANAMLAELEQRPSNPVTAAQARAVVDSLAASLPGEDGERLQQIIQRVQTADDDDMCWMGRTLYNGVSQLPPAEAEVLARVLVSP